MFAVAAVLAFIVMYDAAHVRLETGKQAKVLNQLMRNLGEGRPETFEEDLKELIGHTPLQVAVGAVLGVTLGVNLLNGLVLGALGPPGFALLLLTQWAGR